MLDLNDHEKWLPIVQRVNVKHPQLLKHNSHSSCGEFLQRLCAEPEMREEEFGLLSKPNPGQPVPNGYTFPNGQKCSVDFVAVQNGGRVDVIGSAGAHPLPGGPTWNNVERLSSTGELQWRDTDVWVDIRDWPIFQSDAPSGPVETKVAKLGRGWFCLMRGIMDWPDEVNRNWSDMIREENPDFLRIMLAVEGQHHIRSGMPDPWRDAGVFINDPRWDDTYKKMLDMLGTAGKQGWLTVYGGRYQTQTHDERVRFHDRIVRLSEGRWSAVLGYEMANEYNVNGWRESEIQDSGQDMRSKIPSGMLLALSSPNLSHGVSDASNEDMLESMQRLYGRDAHHFGANCMTIHKNRDRSSRWSNQFSYNALMPELPKLDNEPFGQGASAGGDVSDAEAIVNDYRNDSEAGWLAYVAHNAWCVFNGHMPAEWLSRLSENHSQKFLMNISNQKSVSNALKEYRTSGTVVVVDGGTQPQPQPGPTETFSALLPGGELKVDQELRSPNDQYSLRYQPDGNLVLYGPDGPIWSSSTSGTSPGSVLMQPDGNLVIYSDSNPVWASGTSGNKGAMVQLQDDGNFVIYKDGQPLWSSQGAS